MTQNAPLERRAVTRNGESIFLVITTLFGCAAVEVN